MYRTDYIIALIAFCGIIVVASSTYYFLKDPSGEIVTISSVPPHLKAQIRSKNVTGKMKNSSAKSVSTSQDLKTETKLAKGKPQSTMEESSIILTSLATAALLTSPPTNPEKTDPARTVLPDVHFDFDRGGLPEEAKKQLQQHANLLRGSDWSILIQGHTDNRGSLRHNMRLGLGRAQTAKEYLMSQGVLSRQIEVVSLGEYQPTCSGSGENCRRQNRRVHFSLARLDPQIPSLPAKPKTNTALEKPTKDITATPTSEPERVTPAPLSTKHDQEEETPSPQALTSQLINVEETYEDKKVGLSDKENLKPASSLSEPIETHLPVSPSVAVPPTPTPSNQDNLSFFPTEQPTEAHP